MGFSWVNSRGERRYDNRNRGTNDWTHDSDSGSPSRSHYDHFATNSDSDESLTDCSDLIRP